MKKKFLYTLFVFLLLTQGCDNSTSAEDSSATSSASKTVLVSNASAKQDDEKEDDSRLPNYSRAIAVNKMLGHGINFGNSWESGIDIAAKGYDAEKVYDYLDGQWNNSIDTAWFRMVKEAGFQSIRMPVRWNQTALHEPPYTLQAERVEGVKQHIKIANSLGMPVIINQHHFNELYEEPQKYMPAFYGLWENIANEFKDFSNDSLVFEVLNESRGASDKYLAEMTDSAIKIIRKTNPGRTIMINPGDWGKFAEMEAFAGIKDSNIIIDGHYYEPYSYSHMWHSSGHNCNSFTPWDPNDQQAIMQIVSDLQSYVAMAKNLFPGRDGTHIPLNIGEFGANSNCDAAGQDDANRALYLKPIVQTAKQLGYSWHIWGLTGVGFDIYNKKTKEWYPEILKVLQDNM